MDGAKQREALTAAGRAIDRLGVGETQAAVVAARRAVELDQVGVFASLSDAVAAVARDPGDQAAWQSLAEVVGPGPLQEQVARVRP